MDFQRGARHLLLGIVLWSATSCGHPPKPLLLFPNVFYRIY